MKKLLILLLIIVIASAAKQSLAQTKFTRQFWRLPEIIALNTVEQTSDSGYIVTGYVTDTIAGSVRDIFLARFNSAGDTLWTARFGGSGIDMGYSVQQTSDGGFIVGAQSRSYSGGADNDYLLIKTNSAGNLLWSKNYGHAGTNEDLYSVRQNSDGGFLIEGEAFNGIMIIRTNSVGDTLWTKNFFLPSGTILARWIKNPTQTSDGGFLIPASNALIKLNSSGNIQWSKETNTDYPYVAKELLDGNYALISGEQFVFDGDALQKFNTSGGLLFQRTFDIGFDGPQIGDFMELPDSTFYLQLSTIRNSPPNYIYKLDRFKLNKYGDTLWTKQNPTLFQRYFTFTYDKGSASVTAAGTIVKIDSSLSSDCTTGTQMSGVSIDTSYYVPNLTLSNVDSPIVVTSVTPASIAYSTRRLFNPCTPTVPTCIITVDSLTQKNLVVWEENFDTTFIDSYQVYKESAVAGQYNLIGNVPVHQMSTFLDNASNPAVQAERYRVSALWHGNLEPANYIAGHKTIHLTINPGVPPAVNLIWSSYEGFSYSTYNIWRGNSSGMSILTSVPYGTNSYTDLTPPAGDTLYFIEVIHGPCNPHAIQNADDKNIMLTYTGTRSNMSNSGPFTVGINRVSNEKAFSVYPNPATSQLIIKSKLSIDNITIRSIDGRIVKSLVLPKADFASLNIEELSSGIYFIEVNKTGRQRFIKQ